MSDSKNILVFSLRMIVQLNLISHQVILILFIKTSTTQMKKSPNLIITQQDTENRVTKNIKHLF